MFKQTISQGNYRQITWHDALLRPNLTREYDNAAVTATSRFTRTAYNAYGNPVFESLADGTSATGKGVVKTYDGLQRLIDADDNTNTGSISTSYLYGNKIRVSDNKGNVTTTTYLAYGEPSADAPTLIAQPHGVTTGMVYNLFGNLTSASQGGITQHQVYDGYQNLCKIVRPDSGNEALQLDALGQVSWSGKGTSVDGATSSCDTTVTATAKVTYSYDNLGNIRLVNYGDASPDKTYTYNKNSRLLSLAAGSISTRYTYNSAGLLTSETLVAGGNTFGVTYSYNSLGHLASLTYPSAANVAFLPNALGQPTQAGSYASLIAYHPNGATKSFTYGNGRVYTTTQNARTLPEYLKVISGTTTVNHLRYQYDANANITSITDYVTPAANRSMGYDGLDRLTSASGLWGAGSYSYDVLGNIKSKTEGGQATTYSYNSASNRLASMTGADVRSFSYDPYGNVTHNGVQGFTYNLAGQMVGSTSPTVAYQYDGNGRRVMRTEGGQTAYTLYSQAGQLLYKQVGGVSTDYIYAGNMLVATKQGSTVNYVHTDLLGSPIDGQAGSTSYSENYTPWGEKLDNPLSLAGDVGYTGHQSDVATGLTYMQARYYDPLVGRFMAVDPMGFTPANPMSFNRYAYANDNPHTFIDPNGREVVYAYKNGAAVSDQVATMGYLAESPTARGEISQITNSSETYTIVFDRAADRANYDHDSRTITVNPTSGLRIKSSGEIQSPAVSAGHEISHGAQHDRVGTEALLEGLKRPYLGSEILPDGSIMVRFGASQEEDRATEVETRIAEELGEAATRQDYGDEAGTVVTCGPTSTKEC